MSFKESDFFISIKSIDDLTRCLNLASLLELSGWPKPGNVHRTKNFEETRFEHFLAGITAIQPNFREFSEKIFQIPFKSEKDYELIELGNFFENTVEDMIRWQKGGNVLLGHILILAPLAASTTICLKKQRKSFNDLRYYLTNVIEGTTVRDTINLYKAIRLCNPGGLGKIDKYDINNENSFDEIIRDNINLKKIFEFSAKYDLISREYSTGFSIILDEGIPYFFKTYNQYKDINIATVNTYLKLLALNPDTLIIRKSGLDSALYVSKMASKIIDCGGISSEEGLRLTIDLDNELQLKHGELNPGTTADLISGVIFCALISNLRY